MTQTCVKDAYNDAITIVAAVKKIGRRFKREAKPIPTPSSLQLEKAVWYDLNNTRQL